MAKVFFSNSSNSNYSNNNEQKSEECHKDTGDSTGHNRAKNNGEGQAPLTVTSLSWFQVLAPSIQQLVVDGLQPYLSEIEEIRLRIKRPLLFRLGDLELTVSKDRKITRWLEEGQLVSREDLDQTLQILSQHSLYAWEDEFKNGYLTIPGGHRVGIVGRAVIAKGMVKTLKEISGINYRIGRQILGCADKVLPFLLKNNRQLYHTLLVSPPQCGKTTLLRDIARQLSNGVEAFDFPGVNVGLVDERSEIAGMYQGEPQFQIGMRTDVLDACPKAQGMMMLIRSMSPQVLITDEIGKHEDLEAMYQALQAGVTVITTVHGDNVNELKQRPNLQTLLQWHFFERIIILSRRQGVGTIEKILDGRTMERVN